ARPPGQKHAFLAVRVTDASLPSGLDCGLVDELPPLPDSPCEETAILVNTSQPKYYDRHADPILPFKYSRTVGDPQATPYVRVPLPNIGFASESLIVELWSKVQLSGQTQAKARLWAEKPNDAIMQIAGPVTRFVVGSGRPDFV